MNTSQCKFATKVAKMQVGFHDHPPEKHPAGITCQAAIVIFFVLKDLVADMAGYFQWHLSNTNSRLSILWLYIDMELDGRSQ